jgi:hypothetical protein
MKSELKNLSAFRNIRLISGMPAEELKEMLEDVGIYAMLSYVQNKKIVIPYIGTVAIHRDDAGLRCEFRPSPFLARNIGQVRNDEQADFEDMLARKFRDAVMPKHEPRKYRKAKTPKAAMAGEAQEGLF